MKAAVRTIFLAAIYFIDVQAYYSQSVRKVTDTSDAFIDIRYRNLSKACKSLKSLMLYAVNYKYSENEFESGAIYETQYVSRTVVAYAKYHEKKRNATWFIGTFFATPEMRKHKQSEGAIYDGVTVLKKGIAVNGRGKYNTRGKNYTLLFSDYSTCSILGVPNKHSGRRCHVLLPPEKIHNGMSKHCWEMYERSCGDLSEFWPVLKLPFN
uniref:Lipocalin/cytosolic fatty-acid binding domain-containing protein n=1 Tax=Amblyomma maculatum TaxID=34609 RepID=G3MS94_AMBMU